VPPLLHLFLLNRQLTFQTRQGIGRAIALAYLRHGAHVAVNHLGDTTSTKTAASLSAEAAVLASSIHGVGRLITMAGDISDPATGNELVAKAVAEFGRLDVFVSNAGVCQFAEFLE